MLFSQISLFTAWDLRHTIRHYWRPPEMKSSNKMKQSILYETSVISRGEVGEQVHSQVI